MYYGTTNAYACTGDGMSMAWRAGVPLKDMEFMQFHPTTLKSNGVLITEGCRGEGAYLRNANGDRFMAIAAPNAMELASRDVVSRAECEGDRGGPRRRRLRAARPHAPRRQEDPHAPARLARAGHGLRGRRSDPRADPGAARRPLPHGRRRHRRARADDPARPLRRRRVRVRLGARRQPPGRQLADGDDHVRPPRRQPRRRGRHREPQRRARGRVDRARRRCAHPRDLRARRRPAALGGARGDGDRRCTTTPASSAPRSASSAA